MQYTKDENSSSNSIFALSFIPFFGKIELPMIAGILYRYLLSVDGIIELVSDSKSCKY